MIIEEINKKIQANFFNNDIEYTVESLGEELKYFHPIFDTLKVNIEDDTSCKSKNLKTIKYIDEEFVTTTINSKTGEIKELNEPIDMSSTIITLTVDSSGTILIAENGVGGFITNANKSFTLFSSYLIGKKINIDNK